MGSWGHVYKLITKEDGSIEGTHEYEYERSDYWSHASDGTRMEPMTFTSKEELEAHFKGTNSVVFLDNKILKSMYG